MLRYIEITAHQSLHVDEILQPAQEQTLVLQWGSCEDITLFSNADITIIFGVKHCLISFLTKVSRTVRNYYRGERLMINLAMIFAFV